LASIFGIKLETNTKYYLRLIVNDPDTIVVTEGDITLVTHCDAIVNAANSELVPGGGVDGAIHYAGGPAIREECAEIRRRQGPLRPGTAVATTSGLLGVRKVIHTVGPVWHGGNDGEAEVLRSCYGNSLRLADDLGFTSIAFPAISTGVYGYPLKAAAEIAIPTLVDEVNRARHVCLIWLTLFDRAAFIAFAQEAESVIRARNLQMSLGY
jgi:O-acetyl-ADP-ribose deacetylase